MISMKTSRKARNRKLVMLIKPPHGTPCNGCGECCVDRRCPLGVHVFGPGSDCPALRRKAGSIERVCGLVTQPADYAPKLAARESADTLSKAAAILTGAGMGCDALVEGETPNHAWRAWIARKMDREAFQEAGRIWGMHV